MQYQNLRRGDKRLLGIEEERISVVYQGVDHKRYKPMDKIECKRKFGLNGGQTCVGGIVKRGA